MKKRIYLFFSQKITMHVMVSPNYITIKPKQTTTREQNNPYIRKTSQENIEKYYQNVDPLNTCKLKSPTCNETTLYHTIFSFKLKPPIPAAKQQTNITY